VNALPGMPSTSPGYPSYDGLPGVRSPSRRRSPSSLESPMSRASGRVSTLCARAHARELGAL